MIFFGVSCAVLFDSFSFLMGKAGDVLFFFIWVLQLGMMASTADGAKDISYLMLFDLSGLATAMMSMQQIGHSSNISIGISEQNNALPAIALKPIMRSIQILLLRTGTALLAMLPLLPAIWRFHRYSPDRVKNRCYALASFTDRYLERLATPFAAGYQTLVLFGSEITRHGGTSACRYRTNIRHPATRYCHVDIFRVGCTDCR